MKCYKIKHKPSGLYFKPSGQGSNLSFNGKLYSQKPSLSWIPDRIKIDFIHHGGNLSKLHKVFQDCFKLEYSSLNEQFHFKRYISCSTEDWEIETIT